MTDRTLTNHVTNACRHGRRDRDAEQKRRQEKIAQGIEIKKRKKAGKENVMISTPIKSISTPGYNNFFNLRQSASYGANSSPLASTSMLNDARSNDFSRLLGGITTNTMGGTIGTYSGVMNEPSSSTAAYNNYFNPTAGAITLNLVSGEQVPPDSAACSYQSM